MSLETHLSECCPCLSFFFSFSHISYNYKTFGCTIAHWRIARCLYEEDMIAPRFANDRL